VAGILSCLVLAPAIVLLGRGLFGSHHPANNLPLIAGCASVLALLLSSVVLVSGRTYVRGDHLDAGGAGTVRRLVVAMWVMAVLFAVLSCLLWTMTMRSPRNPGLTAPAWAYLVLLVVPQSLAGALSFVGRSLFRPPVRYGTGPYR
jgi:hypothetical protein